MRFLSLLAVILASSLFAQGNTKIEKEIDGLISRKIMPVAIVSDDPVLGSLVQSALSTHGAFEISPTSSVKVRIGRGGLAAVVSCDNALYAFTSNVEGKDEDQLALRIADAAVVGIGRRWQLKP